MSEHQSKMSEWIGIDLGTTKTVAAVYNGGVMVVLYVEEYSKRIMCLAFSEDSIKEFQDKMKQFKIVNSGGYAAYEIRHCGRTIRQTPVEIATKILKKIRETADEWANGVKKFDKAVIAVPLKFGQEQLVGTIRAANMAGFSEVHFVKEPNAAAYFYGFVAEPNGRLGDKLTFPLDVQIIYNN